MPLVQNNNLKAKLLTRLVINSPEKKEIQGNRGGTPEYYVETALRCLKATEATKEEEAVINHLKQTCQSLAYIQQIKKVDPDELLNKMVYLPPLPKPSKRTF